MDVRFVNPVLDSLVNILSTMAQMEPQLGKPEIKQQSSARGAVSGLIDMVGDKASGSIAITFTTEAALCLAKKMLHSEFSHVDEMVRDLVGEMANMIAGGAKARLQEAGYDFELTIPTIRHGEGHFIEHRVDAPVVLLPFHCDGGAFFVEVCLMDTTRIN